MAGSYNIVIDQGATWNFNFTVDTDGVPWNLSSYSLKMMVKESYAATTVMLELPEDGTVSMNSSGQVSITVPATKTTTMTPGRWYYDIELTSAGNEVTRILEGRFIVNPQVTE